MPERSASPLLSVKTVVRCAEFEKSRDFYTRVLRFEVVTEWEEREGRGCILRLPGSAGALFEIYEMSREDARFRQEFREPVRNDKIDVQIRTESVDLWAEVLRGIWEFEGPETLPWAQRWIRLRDPDGLLIAIYEGE
jgi:catechol 2,3-dioxygenase-like lactoylglutathione lyase family enzyme